MIQNKFASCVAGSNVDVGGNKTFSMSYKLDKIGDVCWTIFTFCYGFTKWEWNEASRALKQNGIDKDALDSMYRLPPDATIPRFTRNQVEQLFAENVLEIDELTGELRPSNCGLPDQAMVTAALTPLASTQADCVQWLQNYFERFSEFSPEDLIAKVHGKKKDLFKEYQIAMANKKVVTRPRFNELWETTLSR